MALLPAAMAGGNTLADFGYYFAMEVPPSTGLAGTGAHRGGARQALDLAMAAAAAPAHRGEASTTGMERSGRLLDPAIAAAAAAAPAAAATLSALCTRPGSPSSTITVSYTGVAGSTASDYIGLSGAPAARTRHHMSRAPGCSAAARAGPA